MDPSRYSRSELERITRRFTYALGENIGPEYDIPAPDVNTNAQIMAWIVDTWLSTRPASERGSGLHVVTGKPIEAGGSLGRDKATGQGVVYHIESWAEETGLDLSRATFAIQGFGNVGSWAARLLGRHGATLVAVGDVTGAIHNDSGIDPDALSEHVAQHGGVADFPGAGPLAKADLFTREVDIFIPAALENQIIAREAQLLKTRIVAEGANGPTTPQADRILEGRGIDVLPDILCNSGGVVVSYFEWLQNKRSEGWELEAVDGKLRKKMRSAYERVARAASELQVDRRTAAYVVALSRLEKDYQERGIFP